MQKPSFFFEPLSETENLRERSTSGVVHGQLKAVEKSNEITAMPELINVIYLQGKIVTTVRWAAKKILLRRSASVNAIIFLLLKVIEWNFMSGNRVSLSGKKKKRSYVGKFCDRREKPWPTLNKVKCCQ